LGQQALVFDQGVANSSWTLPSHSSMMTGRLPHEHRAGILRRPYLDGRFPTLAEEMAKHGYATAGIVANTYWASRSVGIARGFQRFEDYYGSIGDAFVRTSLGREVARTLLPWLGWRDVPGRKSAGVINQQMLSWLDTIGPRPFFAFLNYFDVHAPLLPPAGFAGRFSPSGRRTGGPATIDIGAIAGEIRVPGPDTLAALVDAYDESIAYLDSELGALFDQLKKRGQWDNTLVIVTADHGESYGDHGLLYHGHSLYSDQVNVPLVVSWPAGGIGTARRVDPVGLNQIPATVAQVAGLPTLFPGRSLLAVPDTSGAPIVLGVGRRSVVPFGWPSSRGWIAGLVTARWRYLEQEDGTARLYDPIADPGDLTDLGQSAQWADTVWDFHAKLAAINPASGLAPGNH
jgi:arylsulfatase A-like enzyme